MRHGILQHIALLINKFVTTTDLNVVTAFLWGNTTGLLETSNISRTSVQTAFWIAKALLLRLSYTDLIMNRLLDLLAHPELGTEAANWFGMLVTPDDIMSRENGAKIRLLAKQKLFNICVPIIAVRFRNADANIKANYLVALSGILNQVETNIFLTDITNILPLLLQSLDIDQQDVRAATIQTLIVVSQESPGALEDHLPSLISRLLKATTEMGSNTLVST